MQNYSFEFSTTESNAGETFPYIANHLSYKPQTDLGLNKANQLESTFIEIIYSRKSNIIVGCFYIHPNMTLLDKLSKEYKQVFLLGDFNINFTKS